MFRSRLAWVKTMRTLRVPPGNTDDVEETSEPMLTEASDALLTEASDALVTEG